jgi:hypothetical protein
MRADRCQVQSRLDLPARGCEKLIDPPRTIQIDLRGSRFCTGDVAYGEKVGVRLIRMDEFGIQ